VNLRRHAIVPSLALAALLGLSVAAEARNPHCAGGIQYVVGGLRDKEKGNLEDARRIFGVSPDEFRALRYKGLTPYQIGARGGRTRAQVFRLTLARFREDGRKAVGAGWMPAAEARRQLALQRDRLAWWLDRGLPKLGAPEPEGPPLDPDDDDLDQDVDAEGRAALCVFHPAVSTTVRAR